MLTKEDLIKKTAEDLQLNHDMVYDIVMGGYGELFKAVRTSNTLEISGLGSIYLSAYKILKKLPFMIYGLKEVEKEHIQNPSPKLHDEIQRRRETIDNLKYRYEQIKGIPPVIKEWFPKSG